MKILNKLSEFNRNTLVVAGGTFFAQLIPFILLPILSRIYLTEDFGIYTAYVTTLGIIGVFINGKYDYSILLPEKHEEANTILSLTLMIALAITIILLFLGLALFFFNSIYHFLSPDFTYLYLLPFSAIGIGLVYPLTFVSIRHKLFAYLSINKITRSIIVGILGVALGFLGWNGLGLVVGDIFGQLVASILLFYFLVKKGIFSISLLRSIKKEKIKEVARKYIKFPKFSVPSGFLENFSGFLPTLFFTPVFGLGVLGLFGFAQKIVTVPVTMIARSIGEVFRQAASESYIKDGNCRSLYLSTLKKLFLISTLPFIIFFLIAPMLFAFIFGEEWREAGVYAQVLGPMFILKFLAQPLGNMFLIAEKQDWDFWIQLTLAIALSSGMIVGVLIYKSILLSLGIYCFVYSIKYIIELYYSYKLSKGV